jgi:PiT family inorganic phosphate transporter
MVNSLHYLSAGIVSFARGLNDTPKIVALLLAVQALNLEFGMLAVATAMAAGGLLNARKVAITMSKRISRMNEGQALAANAVTGLLVILASRFGLPVSTTHVSVGAISGIGLVNGSARKRVIGGILAAWLLTLPVAALAGATTYVLLRFFT